MTNYFPADVSLRVEGNPAAAQQQGLFSKASNLLYSALNYQRSNGITDARFLLSGEAGGLQDGALIFVVLSGALKHVYITPAVTPEPPVPAPEVIPEVDEPVFFPFIMWSGVARPTPPAARPQIIMVPSDIPELPGTMSVLDQFHPDDVTASAYALDFAWQMPHKLGLNAGGAQAIGDAECWFPKPGNYSGAMKRVVQALYGLGIVTIDGAQGFIDESFLPATFPDMNASNQYDFRWLVTHGIHKGADGSMWVIEISKANGVLAMPLPIFRGTDSPEFMSWLDGYGDTDTMSIVLEFGGLPTGEPIPTGSALTDAIADGKVLQLLGAADVLEFYRDTTNSVNKGPLWSDQGWAFSESGAVADNVTFWYKNSTIALADPSLWATDGHATDPADLRFKMSQHWRLTINVTSEPGVSSFGSGSAVLTLVEEAVLVNTRPANTSIDIPEDYVQPLLRIPLSGFELTANMYFFGRGEGLLQATDIAAHPSAPVHVFYIGETLETVRSVPATTEGFAVGSFVGDSLDLGIPAGFGVGTPGHTGACVGLLMPAFCREGYVLIKGDMYDGVPPHHGTFPIYVSGIFGGIGRLDFPTINEYFYSNLLFGDAYNMVTWPGYWLTLGNGLTTFASPIAIAFGISQNQGPTGGYVIQDGLSCADNLEGSVGDTVTRPARTGYTQTPNLAPLAIPIETKAEQVTFVGAP